MSTMTREARAKALESMVDAVGIDLVLDTLSEIAFDKGDHAATNWQDQQLARRWFAAARAVGRARDTEAVQSVKGAQS